MTIQLEPIQRQRVEIPIVGLAPVIPHKWSEKSLRLMREKQSGKKARAQHDAKVPEEEAEAALYRLDDGRPGMPATAFKAAITGAARMFEGVTMTALKQAVFVVGDGGDQLVPVDGELQLREDTPRNNNGTADLRYRYQIWPWHAVLTVEFLPAMIDQDSLAALVDAGGNGGVGDWRPSSPKSQTGTYGRFAVEEMS